MSTTYKGKLFLAAFFLVGAVAAVASGEAAIAAFCGMGAGALLMDGIWSGWWKAYKALHGDEPIEFTPVGRALMDAKTPEEVRAILNVGRSHPNIREDS